MREFIALLRECLSGAKCWRQDGWRASRPTCYVVMDVGCPSLIAMHSGGGCARHRGVPITLSKQEQYAAAFP